MSVTQSARYYSRMKLTRRLGETQVASQYPLPVHGSAEWCALESGLWQSHIDLGDLPPDHIIVPSFALVGTEYKYQFMLQHAGGNNILRPLPAGSDAALFTDHKQHGPALKDQIDCWHSQNSVTAARLILRVACDARPSDYLYVVSARPIELDCSVAPTRSARLEQPPAISQMTAAKDIRHRICSPTALAMALAYQQRLTTPRAHAKLWTELIKGCYDPVTKAYGMWPQAIYQASQLQCFAAVECSADWSNVEMALLQKTPVICSIRFERGELNTAPLERTGGHLLLVYGLSDDKVLVMDPAAADTLSVARAYDREQFSTAWLKRRGAAYFFAQTNAAGGTL